MKYFKSSAIVAFVAIMILLGMQCSHAALVLSDGITAVTVSDGGPGDINSIAGAITYVGPVGANWYLNVTTGVIISTTPPAFHVSSMNGTSSYGAGTLTITFSDNSFATALYNYNFDIGGFVDKVGTVNASAFNNTNFFANLGAFTYPPSAYSESTSGQVDYSDAAKDLGIVVTINHTGPGVTSFDAGLVTEEPTSNVPVPPTVWLLGAGLVGLVGLRRKFKK